MSIQRQSVHSIHHKKFWTEFFYLYESLPALWDTTNPLYKNRQVKCDAYDIMVDKLREIEPNADREDVLRKINIFRTNYRRECSRITINLEEGRHYQSTLWYFDLLCFLQTPDTRRDRKRKLNDDDGEKSIMRKRRANNVLQKTSDQFLITHKKEHLIEYQPHSTHDFDYDLDEENEFSYVPDELSNALVDGRSDTTSEIQQNNLHLTNHNNYQRAEEEEYDDDQSQQEYQHEFQSYTLQRINSNTNNQRIELTTNNVAQLPNEIAETPIDINDESQDTHLRNEYANNENESLAARQWCINASNPPNVILQQNKQGLHSTASATSMRINDNGCVSTKFVRDVNTMTSGNFNTYGRCCSKPSESSEILAKSWAVQYDELSSNQKLLARKAISDILFEGCMGHLAIASNGRVTLDNTDYNKHKTSTDTRNNEVESGEVYKRAPPSVSPSTSGNVATVSTSVASTPKAHTNDEWLKL